MKQMTKEQTEVETSDKKSSMLDTVVFESGKMKT